MRQGSISIVLNIAEGTSRFSKLESRNFCVIARSFVFECVAICAMLKDDDKLTMDQFDSLYGQCEEILKMLFAMIRKLEG